MKSFMALLFYVFAAVLVMVALPFQLVSNISAAIADALSCSSQNIMKAVGEWYDA